MMPNDRRNLGERAMAIPKRLLAIAGCLISAASAFAQTGWHQDAHDAQRTGFTAAEPREPWTFVWTWNGPDAKGGVGGHFFDGPREGRTIVGAGLVFVPAGSRGLFALHLDSGREAWRLNGDRIGSVEATPAFDPATGALFAGAADGKLSRIEAKSGKITGVYQAGSPIAKAVLIAEKTVCVVSADGTLHGVDPETMKPRWRYAAESEAATPAAYSAKAGAIVFATADLYVHAVAMADGHRLWRVKPTPNKAGYPNSFAGTWPVVAEKSGLVFVRMRLDHNAGLWGGPGPKAIYPDTNAATRAFLVERPQLQNLFALRLADGKPAFVPAVGYGGVEDLVKGKPVLDVGPAPVIRTTSDGKEVAYMLFRNGQSRPPDGRWDSHLGEMLLAPEAKGEPGDLRFVEFPNSSTKITDEQVPMTMAGDTIFRAHWGASESTRVVDRSADLGWTYASPIRTKGHPPVVRRQVKNAVYDPKTHWTTTGLTLFGDGRYWNGPGWWVYWNVLDPPTPARNAYSEGLRPRYTYASDGYVIVQGNGGELFVLRHAADR
jgi:hypothetical protein